MLPPAMDHHWGLQEKDLEGLSSSFPRPKKGEQLGCISGYRKLQCEDMLKVTTAGSWKEWAHFFPFLSLNFSHASREVRQDCRSVLALGISPSTVFQANPCPDDFQRPLAGTALGIWVLSPKYSVSLPASERCMPPAPVPQNTGVDNVCACTSVTMSELQPRWL